MAGLRLSPMACKSEVERVDMQPKPEFGHLQKQFIAARAGFLRAEVELGLTFAQIAMDAGDSEKRRRCARLALEAHNTIERFMREIPFTEFEEVQSVKPGLVRLQTSLQMLGVALREDELKASRE